MQIIFQKHAGKHPSMRCVREDGTDTYLSSPTNGAFFVVHDLLHYSVETVLGANDAFFGMVAAGRDLNDFGTREGQKDVMPARAYEVEEIVGIIQTERRRPESLSHEQFDAILTMWEGLLSRWRALPDDGTMTLVFPEACPR